MNFKTNYLGKSHVLKSLNLLIFYKSKKEIGIIDGTNVALDSTKIREYEKLQPKLKLFGGY